MLEDGVLETDDISPLDLVRQKLIELGGKMMQVIEKKRGKTLVCTIELWRSFDDEGLIDNEALVWINTDGTFKVYGLLDSNEFE